MFLNRLFTWWNGQTLNTQFHTWLRGNYVGVDDQGNRYFQNGQRRWVIFAGEAEASWVPPEWHGWLHHTCETPPTERTVSKQDWERPHVPNMTGTDKAYVPKGSLRSGNPGARPGYTAWTPNSPE